MKPKPFALAAGRAAAGLAAGLLALAPFHALLTVWLASVAGHYTAIRLWPEAVLAAGLPVAWYARARKDTQGRHKTPGWRPGVLGWCIAGYAALVLIAGAAAWARHAVDATALGEGVIIDLRPLAVFIFCVLAASASDRLRGWRWKLALAPAALVVGFGLLQILVLPHDVLRHFGYGPHTILPFETVDQKQAYVRVQSTLRGANPLGAYLVLIVCASAAAALAGWRKYRRLARASGVLALAAAAELGFTYSRSAYIGSVIGLALFGWWTVRAKRARQVLGIALVALAVVGTAALVALRHNSRFENTFFHTDTSSHAAQSSNQARASALESGVHDVLHEPLGRGPGTAGPASAHNNHPARIAENYFLQVGQETGWLGLGLFAGINILLARELWLRRADPFARALLASLAGLTIVNCLSHAWADETLSLAWWGLAGLTIAPRDAELPRRP